MDAQAINAALGEVTEIIDSYTGVQWQDAALKQGYEALDFFKRYEAEFPQHGEKISILIANVQNPGSKDAYVLSVHLQAALQAAKISFQRRVVRKGNTIDISRVRREFKWLAELASSASSHLFPDRVRDLLAFIETQPAFALARNKLSSFSKAEIEKIFFLAESSASPPTTAGNECQMRVSYEMLQRGLGSDFGSVCMEFSINSPSRSTDLGVFRDQYLDPLLKYFDNALTMREEEFTLDIVVKETKLDVVAMLSGISTDLAEKVANIERALAEACDEAGYQSVAAMCREFLIDLANTFYKCEYLPDGEAEPKGADAKNKIRFIICACKPGDSEMKFANLTRAAWDFACKELHDKSITPDDAKAAFAQTIMCTHHLISLMKKAKLL